MISEVVFVPSPPLLLREYTGRDDAGAELRQRCVAAVRDALATRPDEVVVVAVRGPHDPARGSLGSRVGREILDRAGGFDDAEVVHVAHDAGAGDVASLGGGLAARPGRVLLLVVGDGSARRGEKAPGHLDERSFAVDDAWVGALRDGCPEALLGLEPGLCAALLVTGRAAWQVAASAVAATGVRPGGALLWSGDPWGVMYAVARWTLSPADRGR